MRFGEGTTLEDLLKYIQEASRDSYGGVMPIYVDPIGLHEAEKSTKSILAGTDLDGVSLATSLRLCLEQLDLVHVVKDGLLLVTSLESQRDLGPTQDNDPFQIVGHCLLALIAAGFGGAAAPVVFALARDRSAGFTTA